MLFEINNNINKKTTLKLKLIYKLKIKNLEIAKIKKRFNLNNN